MSLLERLFVGYSYDKIGPHFIFDEMTTKNRQKMHFNSKVLSIEKTDERFCVGTYDLNTFATSPCENQSALEKYCKDVHCKECQYKIGFNPAFYNANSISPQQKRYNSTPHVVYMAYFSSNHIKVGIASEKRHSIRLLEQGARAAIVLAKFPNADLARQLETKLCAKSSIVESLTSEMKLKLLVNESYDYNRSKEILLNMTADYYGRDTEGTVIDLTPYYFYGNTLFPSEGINRIENPKDPIIAGRLIGMIGDLAIISQSATSNNMLFAVPIKKYISYIVKIHLDEIRVKYFYEPKQLSFWDLR